MAEKVEAARNSHGTLSAKVLKVMGIFSGVQFLTILCGIIRTKLVAVWLGPAGIGLFGLYNSALDTITSISQLGGGTGVIRALATEPRKTIPRLVAVVRRWGLGLGLAGALITLCISPWLSQLTFGNADHTLGFIILSAAIFFLTVSNNEGAIFQGFRRYTALARASVAGAVAGLVITIPMYYFWGLDSIAPSLLVFAVVTWACRGWYREKVEKPSHPLTLRETISRGGEFATLGIYITISSFATNAVAFIFISYLNRKYGTDYAGFYQGGFTLVNRYVGLVLAAIGMEYLPRMSQVNFSRTRTELFLSHEIILIMMVMFPVVNIFIGGNHWLIQILYANPFRIMVPFITWAVVGTIFRASSWCMGYVILAKNDGKTFLLTEIASAAVAVVLNIIFFNAFAFIGLGIAYTLWYIIYQLMVWGVCRWRYRLRLSRRAWLMPLGMFVFCAICAACRTLWGWEASIPFILISVAISWLGLSSLLKKKNLSKT